MQSVRDVFRFFVGTWCLKRVLGNQGTARGVAEFTLTDPDVLHYREELIVHYRGRASLHHAYKDYVYRYNARSDQLVKQFSDGQIFYDLDVKFGLRKAYGNHLCGQDMYHATYNFADDDNSFTLSYGVHGPKKAYVIGTCYERKLPVISLC